MLDLLIRNARICDGTGAPSFMGDLSVTDGIIQYVGPANGRTAERVGKRTGAMPGRILRTYE